MSAPPPPADHGVVGAYRLLHRLGEGGMGLVHLGLDPAGRAVAVKLLRPGTLADPDARRRLAREVATLRRVRHPRVAAVIDADVDGPMPYVVTQFVPGRPLDAHVREHGPLARGHVARLGRVLAGALEAIHEAGVVHRDVKPANVMMLDGDPVLIDFGIAHIADESRITHTGLVMGTPGYLSPEIVGGEPVTAATDWWGWGATLAFAATGRPPFGTGHIELVLDRVRRGEADFAGLDDDLRATLGAALAVDPARRPSPHLLVAGLAADPGRPMPSDSTTTVVPVERAGADGTAMTVVPGHEATTVVPPPGQDVTMRVPPPGQDATMRVPPPAAGFATPPTAPPTAPQPPPAVTRRLDAPQPWAAAAPAAPGPVALAPRPPTAPGAPGGAPGGVPGSVPDGPGGDGAVDGPEAQRPARPGRGVLAGTALALVVVAAVAPYGAVWIAGLLTLLARVVDRSRTGLQRRRDIAGGARGSDALVTALALPWRTFLATTSTVAAMVLPVLVGISVAFIAGWAFAGSATTARPSEPGALALGMAALLLTAWYGPGGGPLRRGAVVTVRGLAPGRRSRIAVWAVLVLVLVSGLLTVAGGSSPDWGPLEGSGLVQQLESGG